MESAPAGSTGGGNCNVVLSEEPGDVVEQADDIDGITRIEGSGVAIRAGMLVAVAVDGVVDDYDFTASFARIISSPSSPARPARALPLLATTVGSYGR